MVVEAECVTKLLAVAKMTHEVVAIGALIPALPMLAYVRTAAKDARIPLRAVLADAAAAARAAVILLETVLAQFGPTAARTAFFPPAVLA